MASTLCCFSVRQSDDFRTVIFYRIQIFQSDLGSQDNWKLLLNVWRSGCLGCMTIFHRDDVATSHSQALHPKMLNDTLSRQEEAFHQFLVPALIYGPNSAT